MTSKQESRFSMQLVVRDYLIANGTITAKLPNYAGFFSGVSSGILEIQRIRALQEADKTGIAGNKRQLKAALIAVAMDVSRKTVAYATITNNTVLLKEVDYSKTDLQRSADTILSDRCQVIYDRASGALAGLAAYGVTAAILATLLKALKAYIVSIPKPRLGITDKKRATEQLVVLLKGVDEALAKIDVLVEIVGVTQANFYAEYKNVRKIVATGVGSLSVKGKITDAASGVGLKGATVRFAADAGSKSARAGKGGAAKVKKSGERGGFSIKALAEGSYIVRVTRPGYKEAVVVVHVTDGALSVVDVGLEGV
jgi:Carboxypeptidase regulatory-like domain